MVLVLFWSERAIVEGGVSSSGLEPKDVFDKLREVFWNISGTKSGRLSSLVSVSSLMVSIMSGLVGRVGLGAVDTVDLVRVGKDTRGR